MHMIVSAQVSPNGRQPENSYLVQTKLRERDVDTRQLQELRGFVLVRRLLLVGSNLRAVVLNLRSSGDEGNQATETLPERGDIVADLEE